MTTHNSLGLIGLGKWGKTLLASFATISPITVVCTHNEQDRAWLQVNFPQVEIVENYLSLLSTESLRAVVIATPTTTHFELAKQALQQGKHVFLEKPPAETLVEFQELVDLAQRHHVLLFVDHIYRFSSCFTYLSQRIKNQRTLSFVSHWTKWGSFADDLASTLAYHDLYLIQELWGPLTSVQSQTSQSVETHQDILTAKVLMNNNVFGNLIYNRVSHHKSKSFLVKTNQETLLWDDDRIFLVQKEQFETIFIEETTPLALMIAHFIELLSNPDHENNAQMHHRAAESLRWLTLLK